MTKPKVALATSPDQLSNDSLVALIKQSVAILRNRGAKDLAAETISGELEDLHLEAMDGDALSKRAKALAQETGPVA